MLNSRMYVIVLLIVCSSLNLVAQNLVVDSLGLVWKSKPGQDSIYEFENINTLENRKFKSLRYNEFEKYFFDLIGINPNKKVEADYKNKIIFVQESNGIAIEISFYNLADLARHYSSLIYDITSQFKIEHTDFYLEKGDEIIGRGVSWLGQQLGDKDIVIYIKLKKGLVNKSELFNYDTINPILRIEYSN